ERHPRVMLANYIIGQTLLKAQRFSEAIPYFIAAAEIASAVYPDGHRYTADSWQYVGRARLLAHDGPGAIEAFGNAAAEYDRLGGISDTDRGLFLYWRGRAQMQVGNWSTAIQHLRQADSLWASNPASRPPEADSVSAVLAAAHQANGRPSPVGR